MPWYVAVRDEIGEGIPGKPGQFSRFPKGKDALGVESDGKLGPQAGFPFGNGDSEAACHGFGDVDVKRHCGPAVLFYVTLERAGSCVRNGYQGMR
jgi:hypothetical protein